MNLFIQFGRRALAAAAIAVMLLATGASRGDMATGGDVTEDIIDGIAEYRVHYFTGTGSHTFEVLVDNLEVEYLIVAGGGGGGWRGGSDPGSGGGGGGAGGLLTNVGGPAIFLPDGVYTIIVGSGGGVNTDDQGDPGGESSAFGLTAHGGGGGGVWDTGGGDGGSGGGAAGRRTAEGAAGGAALEGGSQGHKGGDRTVEGDYGGAGGGGAGSAGEDNVAHVDGRPGGSGIINTITGGTVWYAGGGAGGAATGGSGGSGGQGGGGDSEEPGDLNTGGGGGGGNRETTNPGSGGSGIVIVRYIIASDVPIVENRPVANVTTAGADFTGRLVSAGATPATVSVYWGEYPDEWANMHTWEEGEWGEGDEPVHTVSNLHPDRTYYYTFGAGNEAGDMLASPPIAFITGEVSVEATDDTARYYPFRTGTFTISRPGSATNATLTVAYEMSGTANPGEHYEALSGSVTLDEGVSSVEVVVTPLAFYDVEKTATLTLTAGGYVTGTENSATVTVRPLSDDVWIWDGGGDEQSWADPDNWERKDGYPQGSAASAIIGCTEHDINTAENLTLGSLTLYKNYSGTVTLGGTLTINDTGGKSGDLNVNAGTLRTHTSTAAADAYSGNITVSGTFTIGKDGVVVVRRSSTAGEGTGQTLAVGNLTVEGALHADNQGFNSRAGPGAPPVSGSYNGGSHGGRGGYNRYTLGPTYGSLTDPVSLGSGGCANPGGGAIIIAASGIVTVNGTLSADAVYIPFGRGGGAGGSINITAQHLAGTGIIRANGGRSYANASGGGGRISLNGVAEDAFSGTLQVNGNDPDSRGYAGTIFLNYQRRENLVLGGEGNLKHLRFGTDDEAGPYAFGKITILADGVLEIDSNIYINEIGGTIYGTSSAFIVEELDIREDGLFSAYGLGFPAHRGPGRPVSGGTAYEGGSYGGRGGDRQKAGQIRPTYGSMTNPVSLGSGGSNGAGGGAIIIEASGTVNVDGTLSVNAFYSSTRGGGTGGTVNITTAVLTGSGEITANGDGGYGGGGNGGGGRVALVQTEGTLWTPSVHAFGGDRRSVHSAAGTVYRRHAGHGQNGGELIVNNPHDTDVGTWTELPPGLDSERYMNELKTVTLIIQDKGVVGLTADITVGDLVFE